MATETAFAPVLRHSSGCRVARRPRCRSHSATCGGLVGCCNCREAQEWRARQVNTDSRFLRETIKHVWQSRHSRWGLSSHEVARRGTTARSARPPRGKLALDCDELRDVVRRGSPAVRHGAKSSCSRSSHGTTTRPSFIAAYVTLSCALPTDRPARHGGLYHAAPTARRQVIHNWLWITHAQDDNRRSKRRMGSQWRRCPPGAS